MARRARHQNTRATPAVYHARSSLDAASPARSRLPARLSPSAGALRSCPRPAPVVSPTCPRERPLSDHLARPRRRVSNRVETVPVVGDQRHGRGSPWGDAGGPPSRGDHRAAERATGSPAPSSLGTGDATATVAPPILAAEVGPLDPRRGAGAPAPARPRRRLPGRAPEPVEPEPVRLPLPLAALDARIEDGSPRRGLPELRGCGRCPRESMPCRSIPRALPAACRREPVSSSPGYADRCADLRAFTERPRRRPGARSPWRRGGRARRPFALAELRPSSPACRTPGRPNRPRARPARRPHPRRRGGRGARRPGDRPRRARPLATERPRRGGAGSAGNIGRATAERPSRSRREGQGKPLDSSPAPWRRSAPETARARL